MSTDTILTASDIEVSYGTVKILHGCSIEVKSGETVALLGTNGAGKSTLLKALTGLVPCDAGIVTVCGTDISHASPRSRVQQGLIMIPGGRAVFPTMSIDEHLRVMRWAGADDDTQLERVLDLFPQLRKRKGILAGNLSGGEQQMLALATGFLAKPQIMIIDELSLGLSPVIVGQLLDLVDEIHRDGIAMLIVEQSLNVALTIAKRAYFMEKGEVRFEGATEDLRSRPDLVKSIFLGNAIHTAQGRDVTARDSAHPPASHQDVGAALSLTGLSRRFGGITAVDDVTLNVSAGEIVGLIGPNGAGKTTLLDLICGLTSCDTGQISLAGHRIETLPTHERSRRGLGRSFQDSALVPSLTVRENLALGLERHLEIRGYVAGAIRLPALIRQEEQVAWAVDDLMEMFGLAQTRNALLGQLSTGSRRIVDLAMTVAHRPDVLLLDEPSSGIAQAEAEAMGELLLRIHRELGCAFLIVEHDIALLSAVADRFVAMQSGAVIADGVPTEVLANDLVVSSYLGTNDAAKSRTNQPIRESMTS